MKNIPRFISGGCFFMLCRIIIWESVSLLKVFKNKKNIGVKLLQELYIFAFL